MFQFRRFPSITYVFSYGSHSLLYERFPHSEICGSLDICSLPQLIAACHVLRRLPVPRHSPCALLSLTFMLESSRVVRNCMFTEFLQLPIIIFHIRIISHDTACSRSVFLLFSFQSAIVATRRLENPHGFSQFILNSKYCLILFEPPIGGLCESAHSSPIRASTRF